LSQKYHSKRYYNVLLATFGLPVRDLDQPISTIDVGSILGLIQHEPADPQVEHAMGTPSEWQTLAKTARLEWDGKVLLNKDLLTSIFLRLDSHRPWCSANLPNPHGSGK